MARFRQNIQVGGRDCWTVFDTEERDSFVVEEVGALGHIFVLERALRIPSATRDYRVEKDSFLFASIDGRHVDLHPWVVHEIGKDQDGNRIEVLLGRWTMSGAQISVLSDGSGLDFSRYGEIIEEFPEVGNGIQPVGPGGGVWLKER